MPRPIAKLLIANRGEIACRIARTAHDMGITAVAVYSDVDRGALHVEVADEAIALGGAAPAASYLRGEALVEAARRTGCDAVHPGYGFLAEDAGFAQACVDAGLTFVGPSPAAIAAMGDKLRAKELMGAAGVPVLDTWTPAEVPDDAYPVLVKAARGGGGKGMRLVAAPADLDDAVAAARREAAAAFGDDSVFVERFVGRPRHVEVQILGDHHGRVLHLGERECSIQRRHQKVIEESPSPAVDADLRERLGAAAVAAAQAIGYANAGTVEFVLGADGRFFFLEVNTRLQVEHPVTELAWQVCGEPIDLVRLQLLIAGGTALGFTQDDVAAVGHAIEARLYAEDPADGYLPAAGRLALFEPAPGVRVDTGVRSGDEVSVHYDPLIAKVIAAAPTRTEAAARLARALARSRVHGIATNRDLLVGVLRHERFLAGAATTGFLDEHPELAEPAGDPDTVAFHSAAAALTGLRARTRDRRVQPAIPTGWRNNRSAPQRIRYRAGASEVEVAYRVRGSAVDVDVDGRTLGVEVIAWPDATGDGRLDLEVDGRRLRFAVTAEGDRWLVDSVLGATSLDELPRFPLTDADDVAGGHVAPMPGAVVSVDVTAGDRVETGALLVVLEAMKMEHRITAPQPGVVTEVRVHAGETVDAGAILVVVQADAATAHG